MVFFLMLQIAPLWAAPMEGMESTYGQPDGTVITLRFYGDEFYAWAETLDGYTVIFDTATKSHYYATLSSDGNEFVSTGVLVNNAKPFGLKIAKGLKINADSRVAKARKQYDEYEAVVQQKARWESVKAANREYRAFQKEIRKQEKT